MSEPSLIQPPADRLVDPGPPLDVPDTYWRGVLREFRNHLSIVMARAGQLSSALPGAIALQSAGCLADIDASATLMEGMLTWMDAALLPASQRLCEVRDVLARSTHMAMTGLRPCVTLSVDSLPGLVHNRGAAVESALAALIIELARGPEPSSSTPADVDSTAAVNVTLSVQPGRGDLRIVVVSDHARKSAGSSWRIPLAKALLATVGGDVELMESTSGPPSTTSCCISSSNPSNISSNISSNVSSNISSQPSSRTSSHGSEHASSTRAGQPVCGFEIRFRLQ